MAQEWFFLFGHVSSPILPFSKFRGQMIGRFGQGLGQMSLALKKMKEPKYPSQGKWSSRREEKVVSCKIRRKACIPKGPKIAKGFLPQRKDRKPLQRRPSLAPAL
jgi:hypothetical protein